MKAPETHQHSNIPFEVHPPDSPKDLWMGFVWNNGHIIRVEFAATREQVIWACEAWINRGRAA